MNIQYRMLKRNPAQKTRVAVRGPMRLVLAILITLTLLCGTALAAMHWGSRALITHPGGKDGSAPEQVNEALASEIQPIGKAFRGETLAIDMVDAVFEGNALVTAWTLTNTGSEAVYLICDIDVNGTKPGMGSYTQVDELFVQPGETIQSGFSARIDELNPGVAVEKCDVRMRFTALTANGEVVVAPDGMIEIDTSAHADPNMTRVESLVASGLMRTVDEVDAVFTIERSAQNQSEPRAWEPIEKDNGAYILRVVRADVNLNSATFKLGRV